MSAELALRIVAAAALVLTLGASALFRFRARKRTGGIPRSAEPGHLKLLRALVSLPLLAALVTTLAAPAWMRWAELGLPLWLRAAGALTALGALPLSVWTLRTIGSNISETVLTRDGQALVVDGPYRRVRHPLYSAGLALLAGIGLATDSGVILLLDGLMTVLILAVVIPREEVGLLERFGEDYAEYRRRTGRLLPGPGA